MNMLSRYAGRAALAGGLLLGGMTLIPGDSTTALAKAPVERHPHIHRALRELREARRELKNADHDFGGHRAEALEAIDRAIRQLERALKYDRK